MTPQEALERLEQLARDRYPDKPIMPAEILSMGNLASPRRVSTAPVTEEDHVHRYGPEPSGRGVGFDYECRCGHIRNRRPIV